MEIQCRNCLFYEHNNDAVLAGGAGFCRRSPPIPVAGKPAQFAIVRYEDWCGEFLSREIPSPRPRDFIDRTEEQPSGY